MNGLKMDVNPFYKIENAVLSDDEIDLLFSLAKQEDEVSINKLVIYFSPIVEGIILNFQIKNIPPKFTFTELYDGCILELKSLLIKYDTYQFYKSVEWCIRQKLLSYFPLDSGNK